MTSFPPGFDPLIHDPRAEHELQLRQQSRSVINEVRCQCGAILAVVRPQDGPDAALVPYRAHLAETL